MALVIGSGALKCAAGFGVMKALQREAIPIDRVVACSGGAFCGVWIADGGGDADHHAARFVRGWDGAFDRVSYRGILSAVLPRLFGFDGRTGIVDERAVNQSIRDYVGERRFEDLAVPLHLVATDFRTGEQVVMSSGSLFDAIRSTISIPLVFPPWEVDGRQLVDGAVCDPLPIDVALREGADVIIAMAFEESLQPSIRSGMGLVVQLKSIIVNHLYRSQYAFYSLSHHAEVVPIIPDIDVKVGVRDVHMVPRLVELGEQAAEAALPALRRLISAP